MRNDINYLVKFLFFSFFLTLLIFFSASSVQAIGKLTIPSSGTITQLFFSSIRPDARGSYYDQNDQLVTASQKFHSGLDISNGNTNCAQDLSPVHASFAGKVIFADYDSQGFGWSVRIEHGQAGADNGKYAFTIYAHMGTPDIKRKPGQSCLKVKLGDNVLTGQLIGYQGSSGNSTGTHLHWGIRVNPSVNLWSNKNSKWASPDFYTCLKLTSGDLSPLSAVTIDQNLCVLPTPFPTVTPTSVPGLPTILSTVQVGNGIHFIGVNPITNRIYGSSYFSETLSVVDGLTNTVNVISSMNGPNYLGVNPVTNKIYLSHGSFVNVNLSYYISVIDGVTNIETATIPFSGNTGPIGVNPITNHIFVGVNDSSISVIDGLTNEVISSIPVGNGLSQIGVDTTTNKIYVPNRSNNTVTVIDGETNSIITVIPVEPEPNGIGVNSNNNRIYVSNTGLGTNLTNYISIINGDTNTVVDKIPVSAFPGQIGVNPATNHIFVTTNNNSILVINGNNNTILSSLTLADNSSHQTIGIGVNPITNRIYVADYIVNEIVTIQDQ